MKIRLEAILLFIMTIILMLLSLTIASMTSHVGIGLLFGILCFSCIPFLIIEKQHIFESKYIENSIKMYEKEEERIAKKQKREPEYKRNK